MKSARACLGSLLAGVIACVSSCGGTSKHRPETSASSGTDSSISGSSSGTGASVSGGAPSDAAGTGGERIITGEPETCETADDSEGMLVDVFPYPEGPPSCEALAQPGTETDACPSDYLYVCDPIDCYRAKELPGCCRPDGQCGLLEQGYFSATRALGCISREPWIENAAWLGRDVEAVACKP